jgi:hypothetical protein
MCKGLHNHTKKTKLGYEKLMQEKQQVLKEFYSIQEFLTKLEKFMKVLQQWTGWSKSKKEVLQLLLLLQLVFGHTQKQMSNTNKYH